MSNTANRVSRKRAKGTTSIQMPVPGRPAPRLRWIGFGGLMLVGLVGLLALGAWIARGSYQTPTEAPEAARVLAAQANLTFQILTPAYLPREFDRAGADLKIQEVSRGAEPIIEITYRTRRGATLVVREWLPGDLPMDLAYARPVQTKWGKGWLLTEGQGLTAVWVDVGSVRVSLFTYNGETIPKEQIVQIANTLGPASNQQVFTYAEPQAIKDVPVAPPLEVKTNDQGVQEFTLVITPGGYSPARFVLKKGLPVRLIFRQLGEVTGGGTVLLPVDPLNPTRLALRTASDKQVIEFTPEQAGEFAFTCEHGAYRGVMIVQSGG